MLIYSRKEPLTQKIQEISVNEFPLVIITDTHTNIENIDRLKATYPKHKFICLGDITFAFDKMTLSNSRSIQYFQSQKIPCLVGNHDEFVGECGDFELSKQDRGFINQLPLGFKLNLPDGSNYLCYHNRPNDLWSSTEEAFEEFAFRVTYPIDKGTKGVIIGHNHRHFVVDYPNIPCKLICVGRLSKDGEYALLTEKTIEFKKL